MDCGEARMGTDIVLEPVGVSKTELEAVVGADVFVSVDIVVAVRAPAQQFSQRLRWRLLLSQSLRW